MLLLTDGVVDLEFLKKKCAIIQNPVFFTSRNFEKKNANVYSHLGIWQNHGIDLSGFDTISVVAEKSG
jgi:hypothetical protein